MFVHEQSGECELLSRKTTTIPSKESHFYRCLLRLALLAQNLPEYEELRKSSKSSSVTPITYDSWQNVVNSHATLHEMLQAPDQPYGTQIQQKAKLAMESSSYLTKFNISNDLLVKLIQILYYLIYYLLNGIDTRFRYLNGHEIIFPHYRIGMGLYPTGAIFNHSCKPNLAFFHDAEGLSFNLIATNYYLGMLCFRCIRDVNSSGIELCSSYVIISYSSAN